jgi:hypothetical protein
MIGSLLCLFHNLEMELIRESQVLFGFELQNTFFQQILQGSSHCLNALKLADKIRCEAIAKQVASSNGQLCEK